MTAACLVLAFTLFAFALWLEQRDRGEPQAGQGDQTFDDEYLAARRRGRRVVHGLLMLSAVLIVIAAMAGPGPVWIAMWLAVCGVLIVVMVLGLLDFYRTNRYFARKLTQFHKQSLEQHFDVPPDKRSSTDQPPSSEES